MSTGTRHVFATYEDTHGWRGDHDIDHFAGVSEGCHNGPRCLACGLRVCEHCASSEGRDIFTEPCLRDGEGRAAERDGVTVGSTSEETP